jgi:hypothetical protein
MRAVGTDQTMASNFASRTAKSGVLEGRKFVVTGFRRLKAMEPIKDLLVHMVQRVVLRPAELPEIWALAPNEQLARLQWDIDYHVYAEIKVGPRKLTGSFKTVDFVENKVKNVFGNQALRRSDDGKLFQLDLTARDDVGRFVAPDGAIVGLDELAGVRHRFAAAGTELSFAEPFSIQFAYKGRPLNGIWATAPYLHNGSVPNLDELLKPPAERVKTFNVGSREFDPDKVGFRSDQGTLEFDTKLPGNSNAGHDYSREFTADERKQLIEYMKSL